MVRGEGLEPPTSEFNVGALASELPAHGDEHKNPAITPEVRREILEPSWG